MPSAPGRYGFAFGSSPTGSACAPASRPFPLRACGAARSACHPGGCDRFAVNRQRAAMRRGPPLRSGRWPAWKPPTTRRRLPFFADLYRRAVQGSRACLLEVRGAVTAPGSCARFAEKCANRKAPLTPARPVDPERQGHTTTGGRGLNPRSPTSAGRPNEGHRLKAPVV